MTMAEFRGPGEFLHVNIDKYIEMEMQTDFWEPEKIIIEIEKEKPPTPTVEVDMQENKVDEQEQVNEVLRDSVMNIQQLRVPAYESESDHE